MDFNKEIQNAMSKIVAEKMPEMIENHATKMITDIVSDLFRYGNIKDSIKNKIEQSINVNLQVFDLIDYNALISKTINDNLLNQVNLQPILEMTQDIIGFVKQKEITLDAIAEIFIDASKEENEQNGEGEITFIVEESPKHNWIEVFADIESDKEKNKCAIKFIFSIKDSRDGKIFSLRTKDGYYDNIQKEISPSRLVSMRGIEAKIFRLYAAQVKITDYNSHPSTYWDRY